MCAWVENLRFDCHVCSSGWLGTLDRTAVVLLCCSDLASLYLYQRSDYLLMADNIPSTDAGKAREGLIDELETINSYEEMASETSDPKLKAQFEEITDDERVHVGNFAEMVSENDPKAEPMMKEGLKEAKEFEKAYRLYSFQEMMCGASHFEKTGPLSDADLTAKQYNNMMKRRGKKSYGQPPKVRAPNKFGLTRKAQIPAKWRLWSRLNQMQDLAYGAADLLTVDMLGDEFNSQWASEGHPSPFEFNGQLYVMRPATSEKGPYAGSENYYVFAYDPDMKDYVQLIRKYNRDGGYMDTFLTDKATQHKPVRGNKEKPVTTYDTVLYEYNRAIDDGRIVRPRNKREENWGETLGPKFNMDGYLQSDEAMDFDDNIDAFYQMKDPQDLIWEDPSEDRLRVLQSIPSKNLKMYRKLNTPDEFEAIYPESREDLNALLSSAGMDSILELRDPDKMKAFKDSLTYNAPPVPKGKMRAQDYQNALVDHLSRADTDFHAVNAISKLMNKPEKLLKEHPIARGMILEFANEVLDDEEIEKIRSMDIPTDEKFKVYSKAAAKEVYHNPELFTYGTASGAKVRSIFGKYMQNSSLREAVKQNMADFLQNSSPTREEMQMFMNSGGINEGLKAYYAKLLKEQQDRKRVSLMPKGVSPDVLDGVFRNWGAPRIPKKEGTAILTSLINNENVVPFELMDKLMGASDQHDADAQKIAQQRAAEIAEKEKVAIAERNEKFGDLSNIQGKVDDRNTPKTPTGAELALMNASASNPDSSKKVEMLTRDKPSEFTGDELEDMPEQKRKLRPLSSTDPGTTPFMESASFEEMLKSANARQWEEKGLPSGSMEATLPAYYRTVTIGSDRDAVNVYEHKKMPVGGDGINVKKVPGIGPKMSNKGENMETQETQTTRKSMGIREMIARNCFEKSGRIPDVDFMDTYEVKKAANESDFNEMADSYSNKNRQKEIADMDAMLPKGSGSFYDIENAGEYSNLMRGDLPTVADLDARGSAKHKADKKQRKEAAKKAKTNSGSANDELLDTVGSQLFADDDDGPYELRRASGNKDLSDKASISQLIANKRNQKQAGDMEFHAGHDDLPNKADTVQGDIPYDTDFNNLQGAASFEPIRGYRGKTSDEKTDDFENSPHFANERKKVADRVGSMSPEELRPGYERRRGTTGYLETPGDIGASLAESVKQDAISDDDVPGAYHAFMRGPHSKAVVGKMKSHGFSDEEIQSTLRQILDGYDNPGDYEDY